MLEYIFPLDRSIIRNISPIFRDSTKFSACRVQFQGEEIANSPNLPEGKSRRTYGRALISMPAIPPCPRQLLIKRALDVAVAGTGLLFLLPALFIIAMLIRLESKGPVLFRQSRLGLHGVPFHILKFRTMYADLCDPSGTVQTVEADRRVTLVGRVLRKTNLDELPQLWNVLVGDMSLVGPRPHVPNMRAAGLPYENLVVGYEYRHLMRPGLTGLAQSRKLRGPTDNRWKAIRRIACDIEYIRKFSLTLDARILLRTLVNELRGGTGS